MSDDEIRERMKACARKEPFEAGVGIKDVLELAGWEHRDWYNFRNGKIRVGSERKRRLVNAIIQAQTGCVHKIGGILHLGPPTRPLPQRVNITLSASGPKIEPAGRPQPALPRLPSFKSVFGGK